MNKWKTLFKRNLPADFNWQNYLLINADIAALYPTKKLAVNHYLAFGMRENRKYKFKVGFEKVPDDFDWKKYLEINEDVGKLYTTQEQAIAHYFRHGVYEKRSYKKIEIPSDFDWKTCAVINDLIPDEAYVKAQYIKRGGRIKYKYREHKSNNNLLVNLNECLGYPPESKVDIICYTSTKSASTTLEHSFSMAGCHTIRFHNNAVLCRHILGLEKIIPNLSADLLQSLKAQTHKPIFIFDSFRDPLSRSISAFFEGIVNHMHFLTKNVNVSENILYFENNIQVLIDYFRQEFSKYTFNCSFNEYATCGINIYEHPFCHYNRDVIVKDGLLNYVVLRFDNIANWERRIQSIIKKPHFKLITLNDSGNKIYHNLYQQFKAAFHFTQADLDMLMEKNWQRFQYFYTWKERNELYSKYKKYLRVN